MPTDYRCPTCELRFSVGRYHYHSFDSGYCGRSLVVCRACGTQHAIELALDDRGSEMNEVYQIIVDSVSEAGRRELIQRLRRRQSRSLADARELIDRGPFVLVSELTKAQATKLREDLSAAGVVARAEIVEMRPNPWFGPVQRDRLMHQAAPRFAESSSEWVTCSVEIVKGELTGVQCQACRQVSVLTDAIESDACCPACRRGTVTIYREWIT